MSPAVTVLTAVRNGAHLLPEAVMSIRRQTFTDWEYVIVDDASEDTTVEVVGAMREEDSRIKLLRRTESGGPYAAANDGLRVASGRFIVRLDADDVALPNRIERQLYYLEQTGLRACSSSWRSWTTASPSSPAARGPSWGVGALKWRLCVRPQMVHSTACVERTAFEELGGYRELRTSQDLRMWCDLARREWVGVMPDVLVWVRRDTPGQLTASLTDIQERQAIDVLRDHLETLSDLPWTDEEVRALRPKRSGLKLRHRLAAIKRWRQSWCEDASITPDDKRELSRLDRRVRFEAIRQTVDPSARRIRERPRG